MRKDEEAKRIWFTSDLHLLHPKIVDICDRPVKVEDHDDWIIDTINQKVGKKDDLYILGDVSLGSKTKTEALLSRINGRKHLILGNHDKNIKHSTYFKNIWERKDFKFNSPSYPNIHIVLDHYPLASWNRKVHGSMHLYGHVHGRFDNRGLSFDIGIDANDFPLNLEEVIQKMSKISLRCW